jgi:streptogramin lyase
VSYLEPGGRLTTYDHPDLAETYLSALEIGPTGELLVGTYGSGLLRFDRDKEWTAVEIPTAGEEPLIRAIEFDSDGNMWVGLESDGLHRRDPEGDWTSLRQEDGLAGLSVRDILADTDGGVWVATDVDLEDDDLWDDDSGGLHHIEAGGSLATYLIPLGPDPDAYNHHRGVIALAFDTQERLLCGTWRDRLRRLEHDGTFSALYVHDRLPSDATNDLYAARDGVVWAATDEGLVRTTDGDSWRTLHTADGLLSAQAMAIAVDSEGDLWVGSGPKWVGGTDSWQSTGASRIMGNTADSHILLPTDRVGMGVRALAFDSSGGAWLATFEMYDEYGRERWERKGTGVSYRSAPGEWTHFSASGILPSDEVQSVLVDPSGNVWIATDKGIVCHESAGRWAILTVEDGLTSDNLLSLALDDHDRVWALTDAGVTRIDLNNQWKRWTDQEGLSDKHVVDVEFAPTGEVWFATHEGGLSIMSAQIAR